MPERSIPRYLSFWLLIVVVVWSTVAHAEKPKPDGLKAIVAKELLKKAAKLLRSDAFGTVCEKLAGYGGKKIAKVIERKRRVVANVFDELATWEKVTQQIVKDQLTGALHAAGLSHSSASKAAFYIAEALSWIVL